MKLHIGCGKNILSGYVNIDAFVKSIGVENWDILQLPIEDNSASEVLAEHVVEHLSFAEEERFFREMFRILRYQGKLKIEVPDMEWVLEKFVSGIDDFKDFYQIGSLDHYFGNGRDVSHRWSLLTTAIWGNQNGEGQYHKNGYTKAKLAKIAQMIGFKEIVISAGFNKGTQVLKAEFSK